MEKPEATSLGDSLTSEHEVLTEVDNINELVDGEAIVHLHV
jgi:hypothetical protein